MNVVMRKTLIEVHNKFRSLIAHGGLKDKAKKTLKSAKNMYKLVSFRTSLCQWCYKYREINGKVGSGCKFLVRTKKKQSETSMQ